MNYTIKMYRYYGMLGHEKEPVYSPYKVKGEIVEEGYVEIDTPHEIYYSDDHTPIISVNGSPALISKCLKTENDEPVLFVNEKGDYPTKYHLKWIDEYSYLIRTARLAAGLTQQALGEQIGYTGRTAELMIQSIESGRRKVPRDKVKALAKLLNLDPMRLL